MLEQKNKLNFEGRNIYVGIDVHLRQWNVSIYVEELFHKTFQQPAEPMALSHYLRQNFPGGQYHSAYEAGFCGFWAHHKLKELVLVLFYASEAGLTSDLSYEHVPGKWQPSIKVTPETRPAAAFGIF